MASLTHLSESKLEELRAGIARHLDRYLGSGFSDFSQDPGWSIGLDQDFNLDGLGELDGSDNRAEADLRNTKVVAKALGGLSPSLANEERIWARLSHVEGFAYARDRWLAAARGEEAQKAAIEAHFFAKSQNRIRDDHALARLWWNAYIVKRCYPQDLSRGLELLLTRADVRSNIIERIWLTGRRRLGAAVFRTMERDGRVLASEKSFREFMKALNFLGGGVVFEAMTDGQIDDFLERCADRAQEEMENLRDVKSR